VLGYGYGGVAWYYRRYQQFHNPGDQQQRRGIRFRRETDTRQTAGSPLVA